MKKVLVLVVLFILPLVAYLFFASGVNNFGKLPVLTEEVTDVSVINPAYTFKEKITILGFLGNDIEYIKGNLFNLNQKIYKRFYELNLQIHINGILFLQIQIRYKNCLVV